VVAEVAHLMLDTMPSSWAAWAPKVYETGKILTEEAVRDFADVLSLPRQLHEARLRAIVLEMVAPDRFDGDPETFMTAANSVRALPACARVHFWQFGRRFGCSSFDNALVSGLWVACGCSATKSPAVPISPLGLGSTGGWSLPLCNGNVAWRSSQQRKKGRVQHVQLRKSCWRNAPHHLAKGALNG
jgi:hypothetical protein